MVKAHVSIVKAPRKFPKMNDIMHQFRHRPVIIYLFDKRFIHYWQYNHNNSVNVFPRINYYVKEMQTI